MSYRPRSPVRRRRASRAASRGGAVGVVLAGGAGRRIGGAKAMVKLGGRPLITYPVAAMHEALGEVAVVAKADSELPSLAGAAIWIEPECPRHPVAGIVHALELAEGRPVMICAGDLPLVTPGLIAGIAGADPKGAPAVIGSRAGSLQPLLGCYQPPARQLLAPAIARRDVRLIEAVQAIGPSLYEVTDPDCLFNVNTPDDLLVAAGMLDRRGAAGRSTPGSG